MQGGMELPERLRLRVVGLLHAGRLRAGERLPSIRATARSTGEDHRAVAAAYRQLEEEGLVQIRAGSGVYVAPWVDAEEVALEARTRWVAELLTEGWRRGMARGELGDLMARCGRSVFRCACAESVEDHRLAMEAELVDDFGVDVLSVGIEDGADADALAEALRGSDAVLTTTFHAHLVRAAAERVGVPSVVLSVSRELTEGLNAVLTRGAVTGVVADAAMIERIHAYFRVTSHQGRVHPVLASEVESLEQLEDLGRPVLATRAARRMLGADDYHLLPPPVTLLSAETAGALHGLIAERCATGGHTG